MANKNIRMNNFLTSGDRNKDKDQSNADTKKKKDTTTFLDQAYGQFKNKIISDKWKYLDKIRSYSIFLKKGDKELELCEEIRGKINSEFNGIMKELEVKHKDYEDDKINEEQFRDFIDGNGDEIGLRDRIDDIKKSLDKQIDQIKQKYLDIFTETLKHTKGVPEGPQEPVKKEKAKMETRGDNIKIDIEDNNSCNDKIDFEDIEMIGDFEVNKKGQTEEEIELLREKLEYPKENKNENEKENKKCELRRANHVDETLNKGSFFTKDWKDRSTGEKIGFVLINIGLGLITAGIFNAILFGVVRNDSACCSKEVINEIEEDRKSIK